MSKCRYCRYDSPYIVCPCTWVRNGVPEAYKYACMDDTRLPDFIDSTYPITLQGPPGIGKTHSAYALAKYLTMEVDSKPAIVSANPTDILGLPSANDEFMFGLRKAAILILDEFTDAFYGVINYRIERKMPTIMTTNQPLESVKNGRLYSRIHKGFMILTGADFRLSDKPGELFNERRDQWRLWEKYWDVEAEKLHTIRREAIRDQAKECREANKRMRQGHRSQAGWTGQDPV